MARPPCHSPVFVFVAKGQVRFLTFSAHTSFVLFDFPSALSGFVVTVPCENGSNEAIRDPSVGKGYRGSVLHWVLAAGGDATHLLNLLAFLMNGWLIPGPF